MSPKFYYMSENKTSPVTTGDPEFKAFCTLTAIYTMLQTIESIDDPSSINALRYASQNVAAALRFLSQKIFIQPENLEQQ